MLALRPVAQPQEVASVVLFLAGEQSSDFAGKTNGVDGGRYEV